MIAMCAPLIYSSNKYYLYQFQNVHPERSVVRIWESKCVPKIKFVGWLLLVVRLARNMLRRRMKVLQEGYHCIMCQDGIEETSDHHFFECSSVVSRWFLLGITWDEHSNVHQKIFIAKDEFKQPFFMEIYWIGAWCLWNEKNDYIFKSKAPSIAVWRSSKEDKCSSFIHILDTVT
jgi:hypothetical protein